jgi:hypothetical protein
MDTELQKAEPMSDAKVFLLYADGLSTVLDLSPALYGPVFAPLKDPEFFPGFNSIRTRSAGRMGRTLILMLSGFGPREERW